MTLNFYNSHDITQLKSVPVNRKDLQSKDKLKNIGSKSLGIKGENIGIYLESGLELTDNDCTNLTNNDSLFIHDGIYAGGQEPDYKFDLCIAGPGAVG